QQRGLARPPHLVVNAADTAEEAEEVTHRLRLVARRFLKFEPVSWGFVPFDAAIPSAVRRQEPVMTAFPLSPAAQAYRALADRVWTPTPTPTPEPESHPLLEKLEA